jgi:hypothetical protein
MTTTAPVAPAPPAPAPLAPAPLAEAAPPSLAAPRPLSGLQFLLPLFALVVLVAVPLWLFVAPVVASRAPSLSPAVVIFAVMAAYCAVRLAQLMWAAEPRWTVLGVWMFSYSWIAVAGLTQSLADANPLGLTLAPGLATEQAALLLFGLICFDVATRVRVGSVVPQDTKRSGAGPSSDTKRSGAGPSTRWARAALSGPWRGRVLSPRRVMVLAGVSLVTAPLFVAVLGGPAAMFSSQEAISDTLSTSGLYSSETNASGGTLLVLGGCLPFIALLCLARLLADDPATRRRVLPWVFLVGLVGVNLLINNPISNARFWAFAVVLAFFFTWRFSVRPAVIAAFVTVFAVSSLVVFPYLDQYRYSESSIQKYGLHVNQYTEPVDYVLAKTDYASVTDVAVVIRAVDHDGHTWGRQLLGAALFWMPRSVWPDKPVNTANIVADDIGFPNRNLDSPLWAEGYVDFGWVGTAVLLAGVGLITRRLDDAFVLLRRARAAVGRTGLARTAVPLVAVAVPVVAGYEFILLRGSLLQAMARIAVMVALLLLVSRRATPPLERTPS